jgi:hypothetical protein
MGYRGHGGDGPAAPLKISRPGSRQAGTMYSLRPSGGLALSAARQCEREAQAAAERAMGVTVTVVTSSAHHSNDATLLSQEPDTWSTQYAAPRLAPTSKRTVDDR